MSEPIIKELAPKVNETIATEIKTPLPEPITEVRPIEETPKEELKLEVKLPVQGKTEPEVNAINPKMDYTMDPLFYQIANYLGVKPQEHLVLANKLTSILDWAVKRAGSRDTADVLYAIRQAERVMPHSASDERRYAVIYRYIKLMNQRDEIDQQIQTYYGREPQAELDSN